MENKDIQRLESLGFTNIIIIDEAGDYGKHFSSDQGNILINHDTEYVFLSNKLISM